LSKARLMHEAKINPQIFPAQRIFGRGGLTEQASLLKTGYHCVTMDWVKEKHFIKVTLLKIGSKKSAERYKVFLLELQFDEKRGRKHEGDLFSWK